LVSVTRRLAQGRGFPYAEEVSRLLLLCLVVPLALACHKNKGAEGPVERAGKKVDKAAEKTGEALETAAEKTGEAADKAAKATGRAVEKAGQKLQGEEEPAKDPPKPSE
jgi:hypothetical protein